MQKRNFSLYLLVSVAAVGGLLVLMMVAFAGGLVLAPYLDAQAAPNVPAEEDVQEPTVQTEDANVIAAFENELINLYETAVPSVVNIQVTRKVEQQMPGEFGLPFPSPFSPFPEVPPQQGPPEEFFDRGQGSGFVWDEQGHIVTNYHVVFEATDVEVVFADGTAAEAELLGGDPNVDLAVLQVNLSDSELQPLPQGTVGDLRVGQLVAAIGTPFGQEFTMTSGIISAVGRTIRGVNNMFSIPEVIQTDAAINPGNSGGPLLDMNGRVIGINAQILSRSGGNAGVGFAIPIDIAKQVVPTLIEGETYQYPWLGITGATLSPEVADFMRLPEDTRGVLVINVAQDGPADEVELQGSDKTLTVEGEEFQLGGDVITAIDGQPVESMDELITYLVEETRPGDEVTLDLIRPDGTEETVTVTLQTRPGREALTQSQQEE